MKLFSMVGGTSVSSTKGSNTSTLQVYSRSEAIKSTTLEFRTSGQFSLKIEKVGNKVKIEKKFVHKRDLLWTYRNQGHISSNVEYRHLTSIKKLKR